MRIICLNQFFYKLFKSRSKPFAEGTFTEVAFEQESFTEGTFAKESFTNVAFANISFLYKKRSTISRSKNGTGIN